VSDLVQNIKDRMADYDQGDPLTVFVEAIEAVLDLHKPVDQYPFNPSGHCGECNDSGWEGALDGASPVDWPCPTVRAIASALGVREDGD
jgi:hypothetical protein